MDHSSWSGQKKAGPTLALVTALRRAHDEAKAPVLWPTRRRPWRSTAALKSGAATAAMRGTTAAGMAAPGVAAAMVVAVVTVGVVTPTTAAEETVEAEEARLVEVVAREPVRLLDEAAGAVATALAEATEDDETARGVVPLVTVPLSPRPRLQARSAARSLW